MAKVICLQKPAPDTILSRLALAEKVFGFMDLDPLERAYLVGHLEGAAGVKQAVPTARNATASVVRFPAPAGKPAKRRATPRNTSSVTVA